MATASLLRLALTPAVILALFGAARAVAQTPTAPQSAAVLSEPAWPQTFQVQGPEKTGFAFVVTRPGPIVVDVRWQGPPLTINLTGPQRREQTGQGLVQLIYRVTSQDVQASKLWTVSIALQSPVPATVTGQITLQHPPADPEQAASVTLAILESQRGLSRSKITQQQALARRQQIDAAFAARVAQLRTSQEQRLAAERQRTQLQIDQVRAGGQLVTRDVNALSTRAVAPTARLLPYPATAPRITSLSAGGGTPGTPVNINGSGFSMAGEVHFLLAPGMDVKASTDWWSDTLIRAYVPNATGVQRFPQALMWIVRSSDGAKSLPQAFVFDPTIVYRKFPLPPKAIDSRVHYPDTGESFGVYTPDPSVAPGWYRDPWLWIDWMEFHNQAGFFGDKGNDEYFFRDTLQGGWVLADAQVYPGYNPDGGWGVYVAAATVNTPSPYVNVRTWATPNTTVEYVLDVTVAGPKGVPDGYACTTAAVGGAVTAPCNEP